MSITVHVGVMRLALRVPGARTLKDRRQAVRSLVDRLKHRFPVSVTEIIETERAGDATLVVTGSSSDARVLRSVLDQCAALAASSGVAVPARIDIDVFPWHPPEGLSLSDDWRWSDDG